MDFLIVDLNETAANEMSLACIVLGDGDDLAKCARNDSLAFLALVRTHHCVRLTAACLAIRKDCSIVPVYYAIDQGKGALLVYQALSAVRSKHIVERKTFRLLFSILLDKVDLVVLRIHFHDTETA